MIDNIHIRLVPILKCLKHLRNQNSSAKDSIRSIKTNSHGVVFTFDKGFDVNWCLCEVLMLAQMAKIKVKKDEIFFWEDSYSLLLPNFVLTSFNPKNAEKILNS